MLVLITQRDGDRLGGCAVISKQGFCKPQMTFGEVGFLNAPFTCPIPFNVGLFNLYNHTAQSAWSLFSLFQHGRHEIAPATRPSTTQSQRD